MGPGAALNTKLTKPIAIATKVMSAIQSRFSPPGAMALAGLGNTSSSWSLPVVALKRRHPLGCKLC